MKPIYLDSAAQSPTLPEIYEEIEKIKTSFLGNPSSIHSAGQTSKAFIDETRYACAKIFEVSINEVIFTSGATESLNMAIIGDYLFKKNADQKIAEKIILVSPLIHDAITGSLSFLKTHFNVNVQKIKLNKDSYFDLTQITHKKLDDVTQIIVEHANSETGHIQPVAKLGKLINNYKKENPNNANLSFIVDAAATLCTEEISLKRQVCDYLAISAEKIGGFSGTGLLLKKESKNIAPLINGSAEFGLRGGTENLVGIISLNKALQINQTEKIELQKHFLELQSFSRDFFKQHFKNIKILTPVSGISHIFSFLLDKERADFFVQRCDLENIYISAGPACSSGTTNGSELIKELGFSQEESKRSVRISFNKQNTKEELNFAFQKFKEII